MESVARDSATLLRDFHQRKVAPAIEAMMWYFAKGKPRETIDVVEALSVSGLSDAELKARAIELLSKLDT